MKRRAGEVGLYTRIAMLESLLPYWFFFGEPAIHQARDSRHLTGINYSSAAMPSKNANGLGVLRSG